MSIPSRRRAAELVLRNAVIDGYAHYYDGNPRANEFTARCEKDNCERNVARLVRGGERG
jgi:hypothetical protein